MTKLMSPCRCSVTFLLRWRAVTGNPMRANSARSCSGSGAVYSTNSKPSVPIGLSNRSAIARSRISCNCNYNPWMPAPANAPALSLEHFLPYRLSVLANTVSSALAGAYALRFGLTIPQWRVIAVLARTPGLSAADVAERTAMDKVAVSRAVAGLARTGRLRRATAAGDRRRSRAVAHGARLVRVPAHRAARARLRAPPACRAQPRTNRRSSRRCSHACWSGPGASDLPATRVYNPRRHATAKAIWSPAC